MTTKTKFAMLAIGMAAIFSLAAAPSMQQAFATTSWYYSFNDGDETCLHDFPTSLNSATSNNDGDLDVSTDTNGSNEYGQASAWAWEEVYLTANTSVDLTLYGTSNIDITDGYGTVAAYLANPGTIYDNTGLTGCWTNGSIVSGSFTGYQSDTSGYKSKTSSNINIPTTGTYYVVVYTDVSTTSYGGEVTADLTNPTVKLVY